MRISPKIQLANAYIRLLMTRDSLETWLKLLAVMWGLGVFFVDDFLSVAYNNRVVEVFGDHAHYIGLYAAVLGAAGLVAVCFESNFARHMRVSSALLLFFFWGAITLFFASRIPPISSAVAVYGMIAAAESWVYIRVSGNFDEPPVY